MRHGAGKIICVLYYYYYYYIFVDLFLIVTNFAFEISYSVQSI